MRHLVLPRQYSVYLYNDSDNVNYIASFQVMVYGDKGIVYSIIGSEFYSYWNNKDSLKELFNQLNINSLEGYMTKAHARLIRQQLKKIATISIFENGTVADHPMKWVSIKLKEQ